MEKEILSQEMLLNFKLQYPEKYSKYDAFIKGDLCFQSQRAIQEGVLTWCDLLEDMQFLVDLIRLNETSEAQER